MDKSGLARVVREENFFTYSDLGRVQIRGQWQYARVYFSLSLSLLISPRELSSAAAAAKQYTHYPIVFGPYAVSNATKHDGEMYEQVCAAVDILSKGVIAPDLVQVQAV